LRLRRSGWERRSKPLLRTTEVLYRNDDQSKEDLYYGIYHQCMLVMLSIMLYDAMLRSEIAAPSTHLSDPVVLVSP
jgi:hypothetical protein